MPTALRTPWMAPDEYLSRERTAEVRHEYVDGEVFAMVGASRRHATLTLNLAAAILPAVRARGCEAYINEVKVRVEAANAYYYPDLVVTCDPSDNDDYVVHAPALVIEVLSPSTEAVDRREKRIHYLTVPSLAAYLVVAQEERRVEVYRRDGDGWVHEVVTGGAVPLPPFDLALDLDAVYAGT